MNTTALSILASAHLLVAASLAHAGCSQPLTDQFAGAHRVVDSLHPDKPGQARVTASDGSQYTAGQSLWMKGRLRFIDRACETGDEATAASALRDVSDLLAAHRRA